MKQIQFFNIEIDKPLSASVYSVSYIDHIQVQKPTLVATTNQMPVHIWVESIIISLVSNTTYKIIQKAINA